MCRKSWLTRLTKSWVQNLVMYLSRNGDDLVDFDFHSQRRPKILNICVSKNLVDYVDIGIASKYKYEHVAKRG